MKTRVTMNLSDEELALVQNIKNTLNLSTTGAVIQSLKIAKMVVDGVQKGNTLAVLGQSGTITYQLSIPQLD